MRARWIYAVFAMAAACGGAEHPATHEPPAATVNASAPRPAPPAPHDEAKKLVATSVACIVGELWNDAEGDAATAAQRAGIAHVCASVVRSVTGEEDPAQIEALRMFDVAITQPLAKKVKELAAADGLDDARSAALERLESSVVAAARESANARRAAAKLRADIEKLASDRQKRAARDRVALRLTVSEAPAAAALRSASALDALMQMPDEGEGRGAHAAGLVLALVRVRAAEDLPPHMKLYVAGPALAAVFGVPPPPLPTRRTDRLKPGAWLAYATAVAKACGHPVALATPPKEREPAAMSGILAGFSDRLQTEVPQLQDPDLAALVRAAATSQKN